MNDDRNLKSDISISLLDGLVEQFSRLFMSEQFADVVFLVENERIPAHRSILAARSEYFRAMFCGGLSESQKEEIELPEVPLTAFKTLLKYLYTGQLNMSLEIVNPNLLLEQLHLAHLYNLDDLVVALSEELLKQICNMSVCEILNAACLYELAEVKKKCLKYFDSNASVMIQHESINVLSINAFIEVIKRDTFLVPELDIFKAVLRWKNRHSKIKDIRALVSCVRFTLIDVKSLVTIVRNSGVFDDGQICDIIKKATTLQSLPRRLPRSFRI